MGRWLAHTRTEWSDDPDGYLQITDRIKDVIKTGGEWVSSIELEDIISQTLARQRSGSHRILGSLEMGEALGLVVLKKSSRVRFWRRSSRLFTKFMRMARSPSMGC